MGYSDISWQMRTDKKWMHHSCRYHIVRQYESAFKLRPVVVQVTWTRRDANQDVVDYEHFTVPFILTVDEILSKIEI